MTSFNDGIEAAARKATSFLVGDPKNGVPLRNPMPHEIADAIRTLKRPAPSEAEKVERMAAAIKKRAIETAQADESEDWFAEQFARAALAAMGRV